MPSAVVTLSVMVTLDVPVELAGKVTRDDLVCMARDACPDSGVTPGAPNGTQVMVDGVCQEEEGQPVFADVFVEHDICDDPDIEFQDEGFSVADPEERGQFAN